jgi:hypothetical protein
MGDLSAQNKRLEYYKKFLTDLDTISDPEYLKRFPGYDPASLEKAATFFGLDRANPSDLLMLTHVLADFVFGKRRAGRQKCHETTWDKHKKWKLIETYNELRSRHPDCSDTKIAKLISETPEFRAYKGDRGRTMIRRKLNEVMKFGLDADGDSGIWEASQKQVEDD